MDQLNARRRGSKSAPPNLREARAPPAQPRMASDTASMPNATPLVFDTIWTPVTDIEILTMFDVAQVREGWHKVSLEEVALVPHNSPHLRTHKMPSNCTVAHIAAFVVSYLNCLMTTGQPALAQCTAQFQQSDAYFLISYG